MKFNYYLVPFFTLLVIPTLISHSYAGTTFTHLSKSVEIVDWDRWLKAKLEADEYARKVGAYVYAGSVVVE